MGDSFDKVLGDLLLQNEENKKMVQSDLEFQPLDQIEPDQ